MSLPKPSSTASNKVLVLFGPTACGKTGLLDSMFTGQQALAHAVVVSADSVQVYRGLNIGSAKPSAALLARLPHKLIDLIEPDQPFSVGDFCRLANEACADIHANGMLPIVSGGTAYYLRAFLCGSPAAPPSDALVRKQLQVELLEQGPDALRAQLAAVDPVSAARIQPADLYRISRALEVYRCSGMPLSSFEKPVAVRSDLDLLCIAIDRPRPQLYERIDARVDEMLSQGLEDEVQALVDAGWSSTDPGMRAIGYAEFLEALDHGRLPTGSARESVIERIKMNTRRYAKRQLTFMRSLPGVRWFQADDQTGVHEAIRAWL